MVVDRWHPKRAGGGDFSGFVLLLLARDFDEQVQQVTLTMAVVQAGDKVGDVVLLLSVQGVGDGEAEVVVLHIANNLFHVFKCLSELLFPGIGIGDDVGDVALVCACGEDRARRIEVDVARRAQRVVGAQDRLEGGHACGGGDNSLVDAVGGIVGEWDEQQQLREGMILECDALSQPAFSDGEQLWEKPGLVVVVVIAKVFLEGELGQQESDFIGPVALQVVEGVNAGLAYDWFVLSCGGNVDG